MSCISYAINIPNQISLNQVSNVHGHLVNLCVVEFFNVLKRSLVIVCYKVDSNSLSTKSSSSTDPVNVVFSVGRKVVVDNQGNLLHVNSSGQEVSGDQNSGGSRSELPHDNVSLLLVHVSVHGRNGEISLVHLLGQPVHLASGVAEDDSLGDCKSLIKIAQGVQLPFFPLERCKIV